MMMCIFPKSKMLLFLFLIKLVFTFKLRLTTENIMPVIQKLKAEKVNLAL